MVGSEAPPRLQYGTVPSPAEDYIAQRRRSAQRRRGIRESPPTTIRHNTPTRTTSQAQSRGALALVQTAVQHNTPTPRSENESGLMKTEQHSSKCSALGTSAKSTPGCAAQRAPMFISRSSKQCGYFTAQNSAFGYQPRAPLRAPLTARNKMLLVFTW